jgi:hypothetical protein
VEDGDDGNKGDGWVPLGRLRKKAKPAAKAGRQRRNTEKWVTVTNAKTEEDRMVGGRYRADAVRVRAALAYLGVIAILGWPESSGACDSTLPETLPGIVTRSDVIGVADILSVQKGPAKPGPWGSKEVEVSCDFRWVKVLHRPPFIRIDESQKQTLRFDVQEYLETCHEGRYLLFARQRDPTTFVPLPSRSIGGIFGLFLMVCISRPTGGVGCWGIGI